jgi:hypothetical protein
MKHCHQFLLSMIQYQQSMAYTLEEAEEEDNTAVASVF